MLESNQGINDYRILMIAEIKIMNFLNSNNIDLIHCTQEAASLTTLFGLFSVVIKLARTGTAFGIYPILPIIIVIVIIIPLKMLIKFNEQQHTK